MSISNALQLVNGKIALSIAPVPRQIDEAGRTSFVCTKGGGTCLVKYQDVILVFYTLSILTEKVVPYFQTLVKK